MLPAVLEKLVKSCLTPPTTCPSIRENSFPAMPTASPTPAALRCVMSALAESCTPIRPPWPSSFGVTRMSTSCPARSILKLISRPALSLIELTTRMTESGSAGTGCPATSRMMSCDASRGERSGSALRVHAYTQRVERCCLRRHHQAHRGQTCDEGRCKHFPSESRSPPA